MLEILKAVLLGIVEGITEWLPISSTGHMVLLDEFVTLKTTDAFKEFFFVVIQLGAILAVVLLYFSKIWPFHLKKNAIEHFKAENGKLSAFKRFCNNYVYVDKFVLWFKILVASIPAAILGLLFDDQIDAMLTGDAEKPAEESILRTYSSTELGSMLLKMGHHGSKTSSTEAWLAAVNPSIAIISCGKDNSYGHPAPEVEDRLKQANCQSVSTHRDATIIFLSNGQKITRYQPPRWL